MLRLLTRLTGFGSCVVLLSACAFLNLEPTNPKPVFNKSSFTDLPGWSQDALGNDAQSALIKSCSALMKQPENRNLKPIGKISDWQNFCKAITVPNANVRNVITTMLTPWRVTTTHSDDGLFTGYYEASLNGSRIRHDAYQTPIRARPFDHVVVDLGAFKPEWKGQRVTGQLTGDPGSYKLQPYPDRAQITAGEIPPQSDRVLAYVDDPIDAFFLEIQGSGRIALDDGTTLHVGFDERNGQAYTAVGKILVERGLMTKEQTSMQSIRAWLAANPAQAQELMNQNRSYIFFRDIGTDGPLGAQQVALTPLRSLAVDKDIWSYGLPFWLDADGPTAADPRIRKLMVAQDTGGAIKGIVRGDVFWGYGPQAEHNAGMMKSRGTYWVLLPNHLTP